jgi:RNA polymerase sigma-70 factor (ECF subfamily)
VSPFESIYRQYFDFVWASVRRLGVGADAVDDVVQEVFIVIHKRLHTLEQPEALRSWIYGIVRRTASGHHRMRRTRGAAPSNPDVELASMGPSPSDLAEQGDRVRLLYSLLDELDAPKREVFSLVEIDELSVPEVADMLHVPLNTAYSRLRAARQEFEAALARRSARRVAAKGR